MLDLFYMPSNLKNDGVADWRLEDQKKKKKKKKKGVARNILLLSVALQYQISNSWRVLSWMLCKRHSCQFAKAIIQINLGRWHARNRTYITSYWQTRPSSQTHWSWFYIFKFVNKCFFFCYELMLMLTLPIFSDIITRKPFVQFNPFNLTVFYSIRDPLDGSV